MKVRFILLALLAVAGVTACGPKEQAPVKKDMCIQMYSARSLITPENYPDILKESILRAASSRRRTIPTS